MQANLGTAVVASSQHPPVATLCDKIQEWILSKNYTTWGINRAIGI
ncbi:MAG: hypothetical protein II801_02095 [Bacteroidaceae bacterium]|nr:hypothetical protein [Bacteroidaceae bacterium]